MEKVKINKEMGEKSYETRDILNHFELLGIQQYFNNHISRGNLIYTSNYMYPERATEYADGEILKMWLHGACLYMNILISGEEVYYKLT